MVALFCESGLIATTMALTATNEKASVSTFLFLCGSLFITVLCFIASLVGISHILRAASVTTRRMAESVRGALRPSSVGVRPSRATVFPSEHHLGSATAKKDVPAGDDSLPPTLAAD